MIIDFKQHSGNIPLAGGPAIFAAVLIVAVWQGGSREDVTCLCRFRTNDDSVVTIDREGNVKEFTMGDFDDRHAVAHLHLAEGRYATAEPLLEIALNRMAKFLQSL